MTRRLLPLTLVFDCLLMLGVLTARAGTFAQSDNGQRSVDGRVLTGSGSIVIGAVVQIKDTKTLQIRSFITQADGRYRFYGLSLNSDYELTAEKNGLASPVKTLSMFDNRKKVVLDLKFKKNPD
jgi:hypothetical protein